MSLNPHIFPTINSVKLNILTLKFQRFTKSDCKYKEIRKIEFVAKTQFFNQLDQAKTKYGITKVTEKLKPSNCWTFKELVEPVKHSWT